MLPSICASIAVSNSRSSDSGHPKFNKYKAYFKQKTNLRTLAEALKDADVFCGVSVKDQVTKDMVRSMAKDPIVFAMANPANGTRNQNPH